MLIKEAMETDKVYAIAQFPESSDLGPQVILGPGEHVTKVRMAAKAEVPTAFGRSNGPVRVAIVRVMDVLVFEPVLALKGETVVSTTNAELAFTPGVADAAPEAPLSGRVGE